MSLAVMKIHAATLANNNDDDSSDIVSDGSATTDNEQVFRIFTRREGTY